MFQAESNRVERITDRRSFFSLLQKKEKKAEPEAAPATPAKDGETAASSEAAPVIPPVETSAPLEAEPAEAAAAEAKEVPAATNGEAKKDVKAEKRKSSLPFLGKKEKVVSSDEEGEKPKSPSAFSKIRATIKVCPGLAKSTPSVTNSIPGPLQVL